MPRLWQGTHTHPEGTYVVAVMGDTRMVDRLPEGLLGEVPDQANEVG